MNWLIFLWQNFRRQPKSVYRMTEAEWAAFQQDVQDVIAEYLDRPDPLFGDITNRMFAEKKP